MPLGAYLSIVAERQGPVRGSVTQKGREGKVLVIAARHEIVAPRDPTNGRPTGKRAHKPLILMKTVDRASPALWQILCTNENIVELALDYWVTTPTGLERPRFGVTLRNANISTMHLKMANIQSPKLVGLSEYEEASFTYEYIEWTWYEGNLSASDDWETPR